MFQALPDDLQQQTLLRIGLNGLAGRHSKKSGVKPVDIVEYAREEIDALPGYRAVRVNVACGCKSVGWDLRNTAATFAKQSPKFICGRCTRQATRVPDYRYTNPVTIHDLSQFSNCNSPTREMHHSHQSANFTKQRNNNLKVFRIPV